MSHILNSKTYRFLAALMVLTMLLLAVPQNVAAADGYRINIVAVKKDSQIVVEAVNFPANQTWTVRVGTYYGFRQDNVTVDTFTSAKGGTFRFIVKLPAVVAGSDWVSVRLDSANKNYVYNAFYNLDRGDATTTGPQPTTSPTTGTATPVPVTYTCSVVSVTTTAPSPVPTYYDFDTVWEVKNTSNKTWELSTLDYKFMSGTRLHIYQDTYDLNTVVKAGEKVTIRVDMKAPALAGTYISNWALVEGNKVLCYLPVSITVR